MEDSRTQDLGRRSSLFVHCLVSPHASAVSRCCRCCPSSIWYGTLGRRTSGKCSWSGSCRRAASIYRIKSLRQRSSTCRGGINLHGHDLCRHGNTGAPSPPRASRAHAASAAAATAPAMRCCSMLTQLDLLSFVSCPSHLHGQSCDP